MGRISFKNAVGALGALGAFGALGAGAFGAPGALGASSASGAPGLRAPSAPSAAAPSALNAPNAPTAPTAQQSERAAAEAQARRATERIRALQREADQLASEARTLLGELRRLELDRQLRSEEVAKAQAEVDVVAAEIVSTERQAARLSAEIARQRPAVAARMADLYKLGRAGYWRLLLNVDDLRSIGRAYRSVTTIAELDRRRLEEYRRTIRSLGDARVALTRRGDEARTLRSRAQAARAALDRAVAAHLARIQEIDERRDLNAQVTGELQDAQRRLQASVASLAAGRSAGSVALPLAPFRGDIAWPVSGDVRAAFGRNRTSRFGTAIQRNGVLIGVPEGTIVRAVHEGRVAFAAPFTGFGNLVILEHGEGDFSLYGNLRSLSVQRGDAVDRQAPVGAVGLTASGEPGLYFELRIDGKPVDPLQWMRKR